MPKTKTQSGSSSSRTQKAPSVLVILVVKDGEAWVRATLAALAKQRYPRLGIIAVDNGSSDGSAVILRTMLGEPRVIALPENVGFPAAVARALERAGNAAQADYLLLLHDDSILQPGALARMVETAERIDGVGVVGPKVVDWDDPSILREVGLSADRFGYPYSPLEEEELDQGQYDRARDVLYVSSSAMLVARGAWHRIGLPDERFGSSFEDMDFCWRARVAGYRVVMTPRAVVRHRQASIRAERPGTTAATRSRYFTERASLASMLKNYSVVTLLWVLPLYTAFGIGRILLFLIERRFTEAMQIITAWGWNLAHLPGTIRRRARAQSVRSVPDREIRRFMAPTGIRIRRWVQQGAAVLFGRGRLEEDEVIDRPALRERAGSYALSHPVAVAWVGFAVLAAFAYRGVWGAETLTGGAFGELPGGASDLLRGFASGWRDSALGGAQPASPAVAMWWLGSVVTFGNPQLFLKLALMALPAVAGASAYRATFLVGGQRGPAVIAGATYGLSAGTLYAFSRGRIDLLVLLALVPWVAHRFWSYFNRGLPAHPVRWLVGGGLGLAVGAAFHPGILLVAAVCIVTGVLIRGREGTITRGLAFGIGAIAVAGAMIFTVVIQHVGAPEALFEGAGRPELFELLRGVLGDAPGSWLVSGYLPVAAVIAMAFVSGSHLRWALRAILVAVGGTALAWLGAASYLPAPVSDPAAYLFLALFAYSFLLGLALTSIVLDVERHAFGVRQLALGILAVLVTVGLTGQAFQSVRNAWGIGEDERPAAWPVVSDDGSTEPFRVLWLGTRGGAEFPSPGGLPMGFVGEPGLSLRFAVTGRDGASSLDLARPADGPGYDVLRAAIRDALSGRTRHLGAMLAPEGVKYVVAGAGDLPGGAADRLDAQVDVDLIQSAGGLVIFRNARALPPAIRVSDPEWAEAALAGGLDEAARTARPAARPLEGSGTRYTGRVEAGEIAFLSGQHASWRLYGADGEPVAPRPGFGWAMAFEPAEAGPVELTFEGSMARKLELLLLTALWGAALWITRRQPKAPRP